MYNLPQKKLKTPQTTFYDDLTDGCTGFLVEISQAPDSNVPNLVAVFNPGWSSSKAPKSWGTLYILPRSRGFIRFQDLSLKRS